MKTSPNPFLISMYIMMLICTQSLPSVLQLSSLSSQHVAVYLFSVETRRLEVVRFLIQYFVSMFFFWKLAAVSLFSVVGCLWSQQQPLEVKFHIVSCGVFFFLQRPYAEMQEEGQQDENKQTHRCQDGQDSGVQRITCNAVLFQIFNQVAT